MSTDIDLSGKTFLASVEADFIENGGFGEQSTTYDVALIKDGTIVTLDRDDTR